MRRPPSDHSLPDRDMDRPALLSALRARIARLDRSGGAVPEAGGDGGGIPLCEAIDAALPGGGGLSRAAVHEVLAAEPGAAAGFCALLLARTGGTVLWIAAEPDAWPPGLARFGLSPADLVLVQAPRPVDGLWAMEEALRCPGVAGALLVLRTLDLTAARRLQLAAESRRRGRSPAPPGRGGHRRRRLRRPDPLAGRRPARHRRRGQARPRRPALATGPAPLPRRQAGELASGLARRGRAAGTGRGTHRSRASRAAAGARRRHHTTVVTVKKARSASC